LCPPFPPRYATVWGPLFQGQPWSVGREVLHPALTGAVATVFVAKRSFYFGDCIAPLHRVLWL